MLGDALILTILFRLLFMVVPRVPIETQAVASIGDSHEYVALARNLVLSNSFSRDTVPPLRPELFRTPVYPFFLTLPLLLSRHSSFALHPSSRPFVVLSLVLQFLLSLITVWLTWKIGRELGLDPRAAAVAGLLVGLSPNLAFISTKLVSEVLFMPLLLTCILLLSRYRRSGSRLDIIGTGIGVGLLILTRPIATFFPFVIAVYVLGLGGVHRNWSSGIRNSLLLLACSAIVIAPWVIRNGMMTGRYIVSTASEHNVFLYDAATVLASEEGITIPQARDLMMAEAGAKFGSVDTTDEASMWQKLAAVARPHLLSRPAVTTPIWLMGVVADFLSPISVGPLLIHSGASPGAGSANLFQSSLALLVKGRVNDAFRTAWQTRLSGASLFVLAVLALAALFNLILILSGLASLFLRRIRGLLWLLLPILYFTLVTGTVGDARFRAPIEPLLCLFAAVALVRPPRPSAARPRAEPLRATPDLAEGTCSMGLAPSGASRRT